MHRRLLGSTRGVNTSAAARATIHGMLLIRRRSPETIRGVTMPFEIGLTAILMTAVASSSRSAR